MALILTYGFGTGGSIADIITFGFNIPEITEGAREIFTFSMSISTLEVFTMSLKTFNLAEITINQEDIFYV